MNPPKIEVIWEEPPPVLTPVTQLLVDALTELKTKPETWARIGVWDGQSGAYAARKRLREAGLIPGKYEMKVVSKYGDDQTGSALYARYLPRQ